MIFQDPEVVTIQVAAAAPQTTPDRSQPSDRQLEELNQRLSKINTWLAGAHENLLSILNQIRLGVFIVNEDGRVIFLNQTAERVFDEDHSHALGISWEDLLPIQDVDKASLRKSMRLPYGERVKVPVRWRSVDGRIYWMEIEVKDDPSNPTNRIFLIYDLSEIADFHNSGIEIAQFRGLYGGSKAMQLVYRSVQSVSRVDMTVLIEGETGTGKELVARAIHDSSLRGKKPFLAINCAGLTESLLTSQLFGHKKGSFTGAVADQEGLFEAAGGGTLFLDEVGDIPLSIQSSLLRVLQEKEITRIGETKPRRIDVRIIAATHRHLIDEVSAGRFRQDLFYRICVAKIELPPLREHSEDIASLVSLFIRQASSSMAMPEPEVSKDALKLLQEYHWPGNVRELKSTIESAMIHSNGAVLLPGDLPPDIKRSDCVRSWSRQPDERARIMEALQRTNGNRTAAARRLGIGRATFYRALSRLNIRFPDSID